MARQVSGPLRPCGREECRLCRPELDDVDDVREDDLASLLVGAAFLVALFVLCFVLLPVLA
jgi:hypothetical protein